MESYRCETAEQPHLIHFSVYLSAPTPWIFHLLSPHFSTRWPVSKPNMRTSIVFSSGLCKWSVKVAGGNNHIPRILQLFPPTIWYGIFLPIIEDMAAPLRILLTSPRSLSNLDPRGPEHGLCLKPKVPFEKFSLDQLVPQQKPI